MLLISMCALYCRYRFVSYTVDVLKLKYDVDVDELDFMTYPLLHFSHAAMQELQARVHRVQELISMYS